jgi:hypothetical protein
MEPLPSQSDHQRLLVAYSDMPPGKRCRLDPPNQHPKIMKFSNQLGDFLNALKQSLFTTTTTHKRYLTKPEVQCPANTCTRDLNFPTPEEYCSTKGECCKPLRQRPGLDLAELAVALKTKSLARNHKSQSDGSGNTPTPPRHERLMQNHLAEPNYDARRRAYLAFCTMGATKAA